MKQWQANEREPNFVHETNPAQVTKANEIKNIQNEKERQMQKYII